MATLKYVNISLEAFGIVLSLVIIFSLLAADYKKDKLNGRFIRVLLINILVLFSDACAWYFKGSADTFTYYAVRAANFGAYVFGYLLLAAFTDYLTCYISTKTRISQTPSRLVWGMCAVSVFLVIVSQFNHMYYLFDENNVYQRQGLFWLSQMLPIVCMLVNTGLLIRFRRALGWKECLSLAAYVILPMTAMAVQMFLYGVALLYLATSVSALCIYLGIQVEQARRAKERELELEKSRTQIMLSQIQPHFLFNTLTSICCLCRTAPEEAERAVLNFSSYLRGNIDSLSSIAPIPFTREMDHLNHYLEIEKMRFKDKLRIVYDLQADGFLLPCLTVQPIVENAVRHGAGQASAGGTVTISSRETETASLIIVADDGPGFDTQFPLEDGRVHVGIQNVRRRLQQQCGGDLRIESEPGSGTTVTMTIPKGWESARI